jgi:hypothetical protein
MIERGNDFLKKRERTSLSREKAKRSKRGDGLHELRVTRLLKTSPLVPLWIRYNSLCSRWFVLMNQNEGKKKAYGMNLNLFISYQNDNWILDYGATDHMAGNQNILFNFGQNNTK